MTQNQVIQNIIVQCNHLKKNIRFEKNHVKKIEVLTALILSGIVFKEYDENYQIGIKELEKFVSINGANFYNLPLNSERIKLIKEKDPIEFPNKVFTPEGEITVFDPGFTVSWSVKSI